MSFIYEGQGKSGQLEGMTIRTVISICEGSPFDNNITQIAEIMQSLIIWPCMSIKGQVEGAVRNIIKYADNPLYNNTVIVNQNSGIFYSNWSI